MVWIRSHHFLCCILLILLTFLCKGFPVGPFPFLDLCLFDGGSGRNDGCGKKSSSESCLVALLLGDFLALLLKLNSWFIEFVVH